MCSRNRNGGKNQQFIFFENFEGLNLSRERQKICEDLLRMSSKGDSDQEILLKSKYISDGLEQLNERINFNEMNLISSLDSMLHYVDQTQLNVDISNTELKELIKAYLQINDYKRL